MSISALDLESVGITFSESLYDEVLVSDVRSVNNKIVAALIVPNSVINY